MFVTADQIFLHLVGDYLLQSDWNANEKTKSDLPALAHAFTYTLPFLFLTTNMFALLGILVSHFVIDRYGLPKYLVYAKNFLAPKSYWYDWKNCSGNGYHYDRPIWLTTWLTIIADNTLHLACNAFCIWMTK